MELSSAQRIPPAADLARALEEAEAIADGVGQSVSTTHVLLALFTVPNPAQVLLREREIDESVLLELLPRGAHERRGAVRAVLRAAEETALRCDSRQINTLHLLVALMKAKDCVGHRLLEGAIGKLPAFRNKVMSYLTGVLPRRLLDPIQEAKHQPRERIRARIARPTSQNPGDDWVVPKETMLDVPDRPGAGGDSDEEGRPPVGEAVGQPLGQGSQEGFPPAGKKGGREARPLPPRSGPPRSGPPRSGPPRSGPPRSGPPRSGPPRAGGPADPDAYQDDDDDDSLLDHAYEDDDAPAAGDDAPEWHRPISRAPTLLPTAYDLDREKFPWLCSLGRNLSSLAQHGLLDPVIGRQREMEEVIDVLGKRRANNPCLVGEPGVGKTAIAEGLAVKLVNGDSDVAPLRGKVIIELDMGRITAGTALRGSFSERMQGLKKDVERARGRVVIFIDEIHTLMGAGSSGDGPQDAANELKAALARGEFPCIGSTTLDEYKKFIEADPALERRFVKVLIEEPDDERAIEILQGAAPLYEEHHGVDADADAISAAVQLSSRFIHDRRLPGKAVDLLDLAMSRARRDGKTAISREGVARVCADIAKVPLERVLLEDAKRFLTMERFLGEKVIGHGDVIAAVAETLRRNFAGFATHRPLGTFLFLGPSGVGKTELAKALADFLYGTASALIRVDMSELSEAHSVARLVGAPPGYVGHDRGGQLTEAIRARPHAVVLLDEIEKAHPDVLPILLQILDEGRLTDSRGRTVTFRHAVVVMTSNLGASALSSKGRVGFGVASSGPDTQDVLAAARKHLAPELWGRIEEKLGFKALTEAELERIAALLLEESARALRTTRSIELVWEADLLALIVKTGGFDEQTGARPMRQALKKLVETPVAEAVLKGTVKEGERVRLRVREDRVVVARR